MTGHHTIAKHIADVGASSASLFVLVSHFAELATPILTFFIAVATLSWWIIRFREWWRTGNVGKD